MQVVTYQQVTKTLLGFRTAGLRNLGSRHGSGDGGPATGTGGARDRFPAAARHPRAYNWNLGLAEPERGGGCPSARVGKVLSMAAYCTCGSSLPSAASFCPNCGRPLRPGVGEAAETQEDSWSHEVAPDPVPERSERLAPFGIGPYLRAAFLPALCAIFLRFGVGVMSPLLAALSYVIPGGAGYVTVRLFEKRRRLVRGVADGCILGALTGLLCFLPSLFLQLSVLAIQGKEAVLGPIRDQAGMLPLASEMATLLEDPLFFALTVAFGLAVEAVLLLVVSGIGGAIAARHSDTPAT